MSKQKIKSVSELRQDLVSGDWVAIATGRARRPHEFSREKPIPFAQPKKICPFEGLHRDALTTYAKDGERGKENWWVQVLPNKYPAFGKGVCSLFHRVGPYQWTEGVGFHEVVVTRDHDRSPAQMSIEEIEFLVRSYQDRYLSLKDDPCVEYISIFHNHGRLSGASIAHPHSQIIAIPVIPPDVGRSFRGSAAYFHKEKQCVHCVMLRFELRMKDRLVYENANFAVVTPYASRTAFETRIFPKRHSARFEYMGHEERMLFAQALREALGKLWRGLNNPDYNFFFHTAPVADDHEFDHYHWHLEIIPKTAVWAGFEIGTGIEISVVSPEVAAAFLRKIRM